MTRRLDKLKPHPANGLIYGDKPNKALVDSVKMHGVLNPLLVTWNDRIISGHRRYLAAMKAGLTTVPAVVFQSKDEDAILEALIESNRQRKKTKLMMAREAAELAEIEGRKAEARQETTRFQTRPVELGLLAAATEEVVAASEAEAISYTDEGTPTGPVVAPLPPPSGKARDTVAEKLGVSPRTAHDAIAVGQQLKKLEASENPDDRAQAEELQLVVNEQGFKPAAALVRKPSISGRGKELKMVETTPGAKLSTFNETNEKVSWARWTWNPVTGCLHDCPYCYARDIANRHYPQGFVPTFHADRLTAPSNTPLPKDDEPRSRRVFTCSMADLFGSWVPQEWIDDVFRAIRDNPQWEYLCLTKFPQRLAEIEWPDHVWVGTTVDRQHRVEIAEKAFRGVKAGVKWLSCEPLMEPLQFGSLEMFDLVVIGGASRSSQTAEFWPPFEWVVDLYNQARQAGCAVYLKPNAISSRTPVPQEGPKRRVVHDAHQLLLSEADDPVRLAGIATALAANGYTCPVCQDALTAEKWHCPNCHRHWPLKRATCWSCRVGKRPQSATAELR